MKIENQVCTLEQAKKLKELGVAQTSMCYFWQRQDYKPKKGFVKEKELHLEAFSDGINFTDTEYYSAFTVAELGEMLPMVDISKGEFTNFSKGVKGGWTVDYSGVDTPGLPDPYFDNKSHTEAYVRAVMVIYFIEQKIITVDEINKRFNQC